MSSFLSESGVHLMDFQTARVCRQVSSGKSTFFWGTMPSVPRGGTARPFSYRTVPAV